MIDAKTLICQRAGDLPQGAVAWIEGTKVPVLVLASPMSEDGEPLATRFMDLGGEPRFDVWHGSNVAGQPALFVRGLRLEVDLASRKPFALSYDLVGCAFVAGNQRGLIGIGGGSSAKTLCAVTIDGEQVPTPQPDDAVAFGKWRLVHGEGEEAAILFEST